jgi:hypothetical protein
MYSPAPLYKSATPSTPTPTQKKEKKEERTHHPLFKVGYHDCKQNPFMPIHEKNRSQDLYF